MSAVQYTVSIFELRFCKSAAEYAGTGELTVRMARHALAKVSDEIVPLSTYQMHSLLAAAPVDTMGKLTYAALVPVVASALHDLVDTQAARARLQALDIVASSGAMKV